MTIAAPHLIVHGCTGKLGSRIVALSRTRSDHGSIFGVSRANSQHLALASRRDERAPFVHLERRDLHAHLPRDARPIVLIDTTSALGAGDALALARDLKDFFPVLSILICSTGLSDQLVDQARALSDNIPVLITPNTSPGITVLSNVLTRLARALGPAFAPAIIEHHHAQKKDAPSGTARRLASALELAGLPVPASDIHALRSGDVVGEHTIRLTGPGEVIEITHRATTRDLFALGALRCADWLAAQKPGFYGMNDVFAHDA